MPHLPRRRAALLSACLLASLSACGGGGGGGTPASASFPAGRPVEVVSAAPGGATGNGTSSGHRFALSADGRFVAFESFADDLVGDDTNGRGDVFVHDRETGETTRVSVRSGGIEATGGDSFDPAISADGQFVAFTSFAEDLVTDDTNRVSDIFVHDRETGETTRVSVRSGGIEATGGDSFDPAISADGQFVAFESSADNLVAGDTNGQFDVFVHDRVTGDTTRVAVSSAGTEATGHTRKPAISADGRFVVYDSGAEDLVTDDTNRSSDAFVHDRETGLTARVSLRRDGSQVIGGASAPAISANGRYVTFETRDGAVVAGDTNAQLDVFAAPNPLAP